MEILYYVLIFLISVLGSIGFYYLLKKCESKKSLIIKCISVLLAFIMAFRYMSGDVAIGEVLNLMNSPFGDNKFLTIIGSLLVWFTYALVLLIALYPFFKFKNIENILKFFGAPLLILDFIFFRVYGISVVGTEAFNGFDLRILLLAIELIIANSFIGALFIRKDYFKVTKKELITFGVSIVPILLAIFPAYTISAFFGYVTNVTIKFSSFTYEHRLLLYSSILIPVVIYYALKNKNEEIRRFSLIYLSLAFLWSFLLRYELKDFKDPTSWPIHLCHTAMYIVPVCLIFRLRKVYYFTFFINVIGAFLAMAMPDLGDANMVDTNNIIFWINHFAAFFMPVLVVALGVFERPKMKEWIYSMIAFVGYYILVLIINGLLNTDFFYINGDFITDKLGKWAESTRDYMIVIPIGSKSLTLYPLYQFLYFVVYGLFSLALWFIYEQLFQMWDLGEDRRARNRDYRRMKKELAEYLNGRSEDEPMSGSNKPCLELKGFSKKYGTNKHYSVKDASLKVNGGEIFGFLGPNGAGKSTIIKSVVGIQTITEGNIEICGYDVERQSVQAKKETGFVPDHYALYENLTGREYINYIADLYEVSQEDRDARINKYVTNFNLEGAFDNQMKTYSHGMKQKIAIMAALVHNPKVWILDEPLTGLDPTSIYQVKESMKDHAKEGNIVFFSSHIIDVVERICDRIAIIKKGKILADVKVKDLEKKGINLEEFYLETINAELIAEYAKLDSKENNDKEDKKIVKKGKKKTSEDNV